MDKAKEFSAQAEFMREYMAKHKVATSWDFEADLAFAKEFSDKETVELIESVIECNSDWSRCIAVWQVYWKKQVTDKRLKALKELVSSGFVDAGWSGLGAGAMSIFGRSRVRAFYIN